MLLHITLVETGDRSNIYAYLIPTIFFIISVIVVSTCIRDNLWPVIAIAQPYWNSNQLYIFLSKRFNEYEIRILFFLDLAIKYVYERITINHITNSIAGVYRACIWNTHERYCMLIFNLIIVYLPVKT